MRSSDSNGRSKQTSRTCNAQLSVIPTTAYVNHEYSFSLSLSLSQSSLSLSYSYSSSNLLSLSMFPKFLLSLFPSLILFLFSSLSLYSVYQFLVSLFTPLFLSPSHSLSFLTLVLLCTGGRVKFNLDHVKISGSHFTGNLVLSSFFLFPPHFEASTPFTLIFVLGLINYTLTCT